jgi:hypothetical protein
VGSARLAAAQPSRDISWAVSAQTRESFGECRGEHSWPLAEHDPYLIHHAVATAMRSTWPAQRAGEIADHQFALAEAINFE